MPVSTVRHFIFISFLIYQGIDSEAQQKPILQRRIEFSVVPGLGTNGLNPGSFSNYFSLNLTTGYSAKSLLLEISSISNINTSGTKGLQFAGVANITGANAFAGLTKKEKDAKLKTGFTSYLTGAQFAGLVNIVTDQIYGAQFAGGINLGKEAMIGSQVAGVYNIVYKYSFGLQLAGVGNVSFSSIDGVQLSAISNYTHGQLTGVQLSLFNRAGTIEGKNSYEPAPTALQFGLINKADRMNGFQVGLINLGKKMQGTQIGLINIYKGGDQIGKKDGTPIGLINIGDFPYGAVYASDLFLFNYELATGSGKNFNVIRSRVNTYIANALIYATQGFQPSNQWAIGYGFKKMHFNRSERPYLNEKYFVAYGIDVLHINNTAGEIAKRFNMLTQFKYMRGFRAAPRVKTLKVFYPFAMLISNIYYGDPQFTQGTPAITQTVGSNKLSAWLGFGVGTLVH